MTRRWSAALLPMACLLAFAAAGCDKHDGSGGLAQVNPTSPTPAAPSPTPAPTPTPTPTPGGSIAYVQDIKPILDADCVRCHGASGGSAGVNLATYQGVMREVVPGNANSTLVLATRSGSTMYRYLSGNAATKSDTIRQWVLNGAPESR